jgi:glycosyltransferase involved in cell wall biosynthesis
MTETNSAFEEELDTYKYRADVGFLNPKDPVEQAMITAAAYAVVLPFAAGTDTIAALNAMRSGVPVITTQGSVINEIAGGAVLSAGTGSVKEIGEKMMQLYTDENFRAGLIENAKAIAGTYTNEKAGELIWRSIIDVLH